LVILSQQMVYEKIKQQLSTRNGRIILKWCSVTPYLK
jgi:hypothetical protein